MAMKTPPRAKVCTKGLACASMNWGRKDAKNRLVLGLSIATTKPSRKTRRKGCTGGAFGVTAATAGVARHIRMPRYTR